MTPPGVGPHLPAHPPGDRMKLPQVPLFERTARSSWRSGHRARTSAKDPRGAAPRHANPGAHSTLCSLRKAILIDLPRGDAEQAAFETALGALEPAFEMAREGERLGALLVVSEDVCSSTAVQSCLDALAANPAALPWCLANVPAATLARRFRITGPS